MKTSDKNKLFQFLNETSYALNDFKIVETPKITVKGDSSRTTPVSTIIYKETPLKFEISNPYETFDQYSYRYKIFGPDYLWSNYLPKNQVGYFNDVISGFQEWLVRDIQAFIQETSETDLWEEYLKVPRAVTFEKDSGFDLSNFTENEKEQVKLALNGLKTLIIEEFAETESQINLISENVNYLIEKVDSLNKFDWRSVAVSILVNISTSLMLEPVKAQMIWNWFVNLISSIPHLPI